MIEVIKGDARSLDFSSCRMCRVKGIPNLGTILGGPQNGVYIESACLWKLHETTA